MAERERSGVGQWVHTSLLQAQVAVLDFQAARYLVDKVVPEQAGNDHPYSTPMGAFRTRDGYINLGVGGDGQWRKLCEVLGRSELGTDERFSTVKAQFQNRPLVRSLIEPLFLERTSTEWLEQLADASVPAGPIYKMDEVFADPQVQRLQIAVRCVHPVRGSVELLGQPLVLSRTLAQIKESAPEKGAHTDEILAELEVSTEDIARLRFEGII